jgi:hypothetical protein
MAQQIEIPQTQFQNAQTHFQFELNRVFNVASALSTRPEEHPVKGLTKFLEKKCIHFTQEEKQHSIPQELLKRLPVKP